MNEQTSEVGGATLPRGGHAPGLAGVHGRLRIDVGDKTVSIVEVHDGQVELKNDGGPSDALVTLAAPDDALQLLRGTANPVVLALQGRQQLSGNLVFAIKVLLGLRAGSPFAGGGNGGG